MGNEAIGSKDGWQLVELKVKGDVHVDHVTREIGRLTGCGTDADPREGIVRIYVPPARRDEFFKIKGDVLREIRCLRIKDGE